MLEDKENSNSILAVEEKPIFIRGYSRSGGTLLTTIWDAHPDVSMSYELYPNLLNSLIGDSEQINLFIEMLADKNLRKRSYEGEQKRLKIFIVRCYRSGLNNDDLTAVYRKFSNSTVNPFSRPEDAMAFIGFCAREKMEKEGKKIWGLKCNSVYAAYLEAWPNARFINVIRDGRDILASQLNTGSFNKTVSEVANGYLGVHSEFARFMEQPNFQGMNIYYERLVRDSRTVMKEMCEFASLEFSGEMEQYYKKKLTIFSNSMGHLSRDRISKPIDETKIGRWKLDLNTEQVREFEMLSGDFLRLHNYI